MKPKALTLWRPWDEAFCPLAPFAPPFDLKRIENRTWKPPRYLIGRPLVLHAGSHYDEEAAQALREMGLPLDSRAHSDIHRKGRLFAIVTVNGFVRKGFADQQLRIDVRGQMRWFSGPYAWLFDDLLELVEPDLRCRGRQGVWTINDELASQLPIQEGIRA